MFRTGKRHKLTSEAGKRNERGVDPVITPAAADRVVELLVSYGGGTAEPGVTVVGEPPDPPRSRCRTDLPARISGIEIPADTAVENLEKVGCLVEDGGFVPPHLAPRPHRPLRPGRGGRPDRRLRPGAVGAARARPPAAG